jgi:hypothetical protein
MTFRVDELKSIVSKSGGFARGNLFRVFLPSLGAANTFDLNLLCKGAILPGRQVTSAEHSMGTVMRKYASGYATTDLTLTFHVMHDHAVKNYFETWQSLAHSNSSYEVGYYNDYVKTVIIQQVQKGVTIPIFQKQLGITNKIPPFILERLPDLGPLDTSRGTVDINFQTSSTPVYTCALMEAFPTTMNDILLGDGEDGVMELSVQLSFKDWISGRMAPDDNLGASIAGFGINKIKQLF